MKNIIAAALVILPLAAQAGDVTGLWQTAPNEEGKYLQVQIAACADNSAQICGVITAGFGGASQDNNGKPIIWGMQRKSEDFWNRGNVWAPDSDKTYRANLTLEGDQLVVQGCVAGIFCRSSVWTRAQ
ncbi:MAG: DUF2147 domain-containing protein [Rhodobacteraceae bacterium]|nr:DUF2147 domain-containing protein [Paracoccaceae bacterium]